MRNHEIIRKKRYEIIRNLGSGNIKSNNCKYSFLFFGKDIYAQTGIRTIKGARKELETLANAYIKGEKDRGVGEIRKKVNNENTILLKRYDIFYSKRLILKERL